MKLNSKLFWAIAPTLFALTSCGVSRVESGKAIYCPAAKLERVTGEAAIADDWQEPGEESGYVNITNLLNGKKARTHILMKKTTSTGTVVISISKKTAEALGMVHTGLAPVEIKYKRTL